MKAQTWKAIQQHLVNQREYETVKTRTTGDISAGAMNELSNAMGVRDRSLARMIDFLMNEEEFE